MYFLYSQKYIKIELKLNIDFNSLCDWFVDNKLSIHFGEEKTKSILFSPKNKCKSADPIVKTKRSYPETVFNC